MPRRGTSWRARACAAACVLVSPVPLWAQSDSLPSSAIKLKPTIGLGAGMFAFYGDVGNNHTGYSPLVTRVGYDLRATVPLTPWLEGGLHALHGRLGMNERGEGRNLNFESRITMGGLHFRYNFHQVLKRDRFVEPFLLFGFESVEFLTKTDLYDRQGRAYHYWSDGSVRDLPEDSPNAGRAVHLQRDYNYETDVRELNADGFGKYPERTFAVPLGGGVRMDIGGGFDFRLGATMHFTLTDMVDGVSDQSREGRQGDGRNDRFLYTSFSFGYAIPLERKARKPKSKTPLTPDEIDLLVFDADQDGDGVPDIADKSPNTPPGVKVDKDGRPLDTDLDGVPDHLDEEPGTAKDAPVDHRGVTLTDADFLRGWLAWKDSGNVAMVFSRVESSGPVPVARRTAKRVYVVKVGAQVEGISESLIHKILSLPDVRTLERGDTTFYVVGSYDAIPEALRRELELRGWGIESLVMAEEAGKLIDISSELDAERARLEGQPVPETAAATTVRVQLGAFKNKLSQNIFRDIKDLVVIQGDDGLTRYYTGSFTDVNQAAAHKVRMLLNGFEGAFLVAFKDGKRVSMKEAGAKLTGQEDLRAVAFGTVSQDRMRYRVQVGTFLGNAPMDAMGSYIELGDVTPLVGADAVRYLHGSFTSRADAEKARERAQAMGITDAFVVGEMNGAIIPADDVDRLLGKP